MAAIFRSKMVRQYRHKGFTFAESMLVLLVITLMIVLSVNTSVPYRYENSVDMIIEGITMTQLKAIKTDDYADYDNDEHDIHVTFNRKGNVLMADCFTVSGRDIIVALGTGRTYVRP